MALFNTSSAIAQDKLFEQKYNTLVTLLNKWADSVAAKLLTFATGALAIFTGQTAARTYTLPDADGTIPLEASNTFSPTLLGSGTAGTWAYTTQSGYYHKIGKLVFIAITLKPSSITGSPTGTLAVGNLPFTAAAINQHMSVEDDGIDYSAGYTMLKALVVQSGTSMLIYQNGDNVARTGLPVGAIVAGEEIRITGCYESA